ncbi:hypothetical protein BaRGS_00037208 [Batillaria attramentaria]|uniref:Uncharacterized protein n=1 Tax=Batillaria attramentaria TaxID=370345 RepID=A0ABD0J1M8_9CAEN
MQRRQDLSACTNSTSSSVQKAASISTPSRHAKSLDEHGFSCRLKVFSPSRSELESCKTSPVLCFRLTKTCRMPGKRKAKASLVCQQAWKVRLSRCTVRISEISCQIWHTHSLPPSVSGSAL